MNDRREIFGWTMYDWANSAFSTTVVAALLGPYIIELANRSSTSLTIFGAELQPAAIFPFATSLSVFLQVFFLPILGTLADYTDLKKKLMMAFAYTGAIATILLYFIQADMPAFGTNGAVLLGSLLFIIANLSFGAAIVFYNAYLPEIASPDTRDQVSARGFAYGYLGGGLLLLINLVMLLRMEDTALAVRLSLASAGVWWLFFTFLFPQQRLRASEGGKQLPAGENFITFGIRQLLGTLREMRTKYPQTLSYLLAYLIYNDGIQTVIAVSSSYASDEIGMATDNLLLLVLMIQFVAFGGAFLFGFLAKRWGAKRSILISLVIWSAAVIYAYAFMNNVAQVFVLGFVIAIVLGGSQALSRSLFAQMIPPDQEAEYFGFYEISERGTSWIGPLVFAAAVQVTGGSQRIAIVSLIIFFVVGLFLLNRVNVKQAILEAGNDPTGVIL